MTLAGVGSGSSLENLDAFRKNCRDTADQFEKLGSVEVAKVTREAPGRIPFLVKDPRGHADFYAALARHDSKGSANTMRGFQGGRPSIYTLTEAIEKATTPALIICGDEDDACVEPSLFLKKHLPASGLTFFPEVGPRAQSGRAGAVQRDGRALHRAGRGQPLGRARSEVGVGLSFVTRGDRMTRVKSRNRCAHAGYSLIQGWKSLSGFSLCQHSLVLGFDIWLVGITHNLVQSCVPAYFRPIQAPAQQR